MTDALADVTREDFLAWADEAQSFIDGNEMLISDMRKAKATVALLRQAAAPQALAGEIMRDKLAELQNAGVKSLTINQIVGLLGFSETEAAQPASPLRGREALATLIREYARDLRRNSSGGDDYPWEYAKGTADYLEVLIDRAAVPATGRDQVLVPRELTAENGAKYALIGEFFEEFQWVDEDDEEHTTKIPVSWTTIKEIHKRMVAHFSASPPDLSSRSAAKAEQPETRQQKNEREMAEGSRCDGSCNDGMPCHCQPAADPGTEDNRETLALVLARKFPETFTPYGNRRAPNALAFNVVDTFLDTISPAAPDKEPELPAARPMGQS